MYSLAISTKENLKVFRLLSAARSKVTTLVAKLLFGSALAIVLTACDIAVDSDTCSKVGKNYLRDADFALEQKDPQSKHWVGLQHAGETSFEFTFEDGELSIQKIGTQPWGILRQKLRNADLGGARMAFTAEIKLDLSGEGVQAYPIGGGLELTARSGRNRILLHSALNHKPRLGNTPWQTVEVIVDIPNRTKVIDLSFLHQASGLMQIRNPSFHLVDASSIACAVTPDLFPVSK
jgi:hypothetical protein